MYFPTSKRMRSLGFRLTLLYSTGCTLTLVAVLALAYITLGATLQLEMDEHLANEIEEYGALLQKQNLAVLGDVLHHEALSEGIDRIFFQVLDIKGQSLFQTEMAAWAGLNVNHQSLAAAVEGTIVVNGVKIPSSPFQVRVIYGRMTPDLVLQIGESTAENASMLARFRRLFLMTTILFFLCSIALGFWLSQRATNGIQEVTRTAQGIMDGNWQFRVPVSKRDDEIDDLARTFNEMVGRIQTLIRELREVTDDIAHDLRTPLTRVHSAAEHICRGQVDDETQQSAESILEECNRLMGLINAMLDISQTEAGARPLNLESIDLPFLLDDAVELFSPSAEEKGIALVFNNGCSSRLMGDLHRIRQLITHLLDNAIKYSPAGGRIEVRCQENANAIMVSVEDQGIGIAPDNVGKIFDRFYRADESRSSVGNGLGLSLAYAIAKAHGGQLDVESTLGIGSIFRFTLPKS